MTASKRRLLVNIYQLNTEVVYTGYVRRVSHADFILETYNEQGIRDGGVLLRQSNVDFVETDSFDLDYMKRLIRINDHYNLHHEALQLKLAGDSNLFMSTLRLLWQRQAVVQLIVKSDDDKKRYHEGVIVQIDDEKLEFDQINKFNFTKRQFEIIALNDVIGAEFAGKEMKLVAQELDLMVPDKHQTSQPLSIVDSVATIKQLAQTKQWAIFQLANEKQFFYIGQVVVANDAEAVIRVADANGQFGGYVWFRYIEVHKIINVDDYLQLITTIIQKNQMTNQFDVAVLNGERDFDAGDNIMFHILEQAYYFKRVIHISALNQADISGIITEFDHQNYTITVKATDEDIVDTRVIMIEQIVEMAFEYVKAFIEEKRLKA